jgi:iron complex outermembrane receptor protein
MNRRIALQLYAVCLFSAASLQAQQLEEVLVTATKRTESLQDVPISVAVVSGAELEKRNKTQIADISRVVPGFTFSSGTSDAGRNIILRGVGTQSFSRSVEQSVGTVIDGVASTSLSGSLLDFSDVERVEVLRGPQGMLFGKNASAGLLSITTRAPTEEPGAGFGIRYGSESLLNLNGFVSGPIVEGKLLGRISAFSNSQDPLLDNKYPGGDGLNDRDDWGTRVKLKWFATENLDAMLSYTHNERDHKCCQGALRVVVPGSVSDTEGGPVGDEVDEILDNDTAEGTTDQDIASLEINYMMGDFLFTSISAYTEDDIFGAFRSDLYTRTALPLNDSWEDYEQFTQELRLTSPTEGALSYVAGLYYYDQDIDRSFERVIDLYGIGLAPAGQLSVLNDHTNTSESFAVFGQLNLDITDTTRLLLGARYNDDEISIDQTVGFIEGTLPEAPPGSIKGKTDDQAWSWRVIGELDITDDTMVYASVARGYKGPGSNSLTSGPSTGDVFVDPEIPTNYELGIKSEWWDNRLRLNGAIYYTEFEDFQASTQVPNAFPPIFFLTNAGELETEGVEMEFTAQLTENLALSGSVAYTDAIFSDWEDAPCYSGQTEAQGCVNETQDLSGADMPSSPDWAYNLNADYYIPFASRPFTGFASATWYWRDEVQFSTTNDPLHVGDSYGTLDLSFGIAANDGRYTVQVFMLNALDDFYEADIEGQSVVGILAAHAMAYDYKRRYGMALQMAF